MKKIKERFEPNDILTLSSGFLARYAGSNKYDDIERFQNNLFIWVRDEVAEGRRFNSHIEALEAFIAERDEYRRTHNTYEIEVFESVKISQDDHDIILEKGDKVQILSKMSESGKLTRNGWEYDPRDRGMQGLPSLTKDIEGGRISIVLTYEKRARNPFQIAEWVRVKADWGELDWDVDWIQDFATVAQVLDVVTKKWGTAMEAEDLFVLMGGDL